MVIITKNGRKSVWAGVRVHLLRIGSALDGLAPDPVMWD